MKKRILIVLSITSVLLFSFITINNIENTVETEYTIQFQVTLDSTMLPDFGVQIDTANTDDIIVLSEGQTFSFAFFHNVALTSWGRALPGAYGNGWQPDVWWYSQEVNFTKYGDNEIHFLETRMYGSFEVYIDDYSLGYSNLDPSASDDDTNQTVALDLSLDEHYLTIIAAEYQLPYIGATIDEAQLVWTKDQHMFYVIADSGDPLPVRKDRDIFVSTVGTPYAENFEYFRGVPLERPKVQLLNIDDTSWSNIEISYRYNVSTDGIFSVAEDSLGIEFSKVGDGEVVRWINDDPFSTELEQLRSHHNYVYICAISTNPDDFMLYYSSVYGHEGCYYPILKFDTLIVDLYVETEYTEYEGENVTVTSTIYETEYVPEFSSFSIGLLLSFLMMVPLLILLAKKKKKGGKDNEV